MNKTFDFGRFRRYFCYDLASDCKKAGISVLTLSLFPFYSFFFFELFSLILSGSMSSMNIGNSIFAYIVSFFIIVILFPVRCYGEITDRRKGSNWLLRPASAFEKYLSMILITCVVLPAVWLAGMFLSECALHLLFPSYVSIGLPRMVEGLDAILAQFHTDAGKTLAINAGVSLYLDWCQDILVFLLGAVLFRHNKIVYTFLSIMGLSFLFSLVSIPLAKMISVEDLQALALDSENVLMWFNIFIYSVSIVTFAALNLGIYFRIKSIKQ